MSSLSAVFFQRRMNAELAAWRGAALSAVAALLLALVAIGVVAVWHLRQQGGHDESKKPLRGGTADAEHGECDYRDAPAADARSPQPKLLAADIKRGNGLKAARTSLADGLSDVPPEVRERLRQLLKEEISRGLCVAPPPRSTSPPFPPLLPGELSLPAPLELSPRPPSGPPSPLRGAAARALGVASSSYAPVFCAAAAVEEEEGIAAKRDAQTLTFTFGPTPKQRRQVDPPEKNANLFGKEASALKASMGTIQKQLIRRDAQTQELSRQLRDLQEVLRSRMAEKTSSTTRLQDVLCDSSLAPQLQAEELKTVQQDVKELALKLGDMKKSEIRWCNVARRQQAFFMQRERLLHEGGTSVLRRHPAGELLLAPPPVVVEGEEEECRKPLWDVGTFVINPYATDSWPFEPNVLAQRCTMEATLQALEEDEDAELMAMEESSGESAYGDEEELEDVEHEQRNADDDSELEVIAGADVDDDESLEAVELPTFPADERQHALAWEESAAAAAAVDAVFAAKATSLSTPPLPASPARGCPAALPPPPKGEAIALAPPYKM